MWAVAASGHHVSDGPRPPAPRGFVGNHVACRISRQHLDRVSVARKQSVLAADRRGSCGSHLAQCRGGALILRHLLEHQLPPATRHDDLAGWRSVEHDRPRLGLDGPAMEPGRNRCDDRQHKGIASTPGDDESAKREAALAAPKPCSRASASQVCASPSVMLRIASLSYHVAGTPGRLAPVPRVPAREPIAIPTKKPRPVAAVNAAAGSLRV